MKVRCAFCKDYVERESAYRQGLQSFCSEDHFHSLNYSKYKKRKSSLIKKSKNDLSKDDKLEIIRLDGYSCRFCNRRNALHVHHVIYRSEGGSNDQSNLITLCYEHHDLIHSNKKRYQPLCQKIIEIREKYSHNTITIPDLEKAATIDSSLKNLLPIIELRSNRLDP
jgi:5-methylcytosine-specific restriction endonuclease McrA